MERKYKIVHGKKKKNDGVNWRADFANNIVDSKERYFDIIVYIIEILSDILISNIYIYIYIYKVYIYIYIYIYISSCISCVIYGLCNQGHLILEQIISLNVLKGNVIICHTILSLKILSW